MELAFSGPATPLTDAAIEAAARQIGCDVAAVRAVIDVESRGGFLPDGRPKILFERHWFSRLTQRAFDAAHPDIACPQRGGYLGGAAEYGRLARAIALDRDAALRSASWGAFQIMGDNYRHCGFVSAEAFVAAMVSGSAAQLEAFTRFVTATGLGDELVRRDWAGFARGYNGPGYRANTYDEKLAARYAVHARAGGALPMLQQGQRGDAVALLQRVLGIAADGIFGPGTVQAVRNFQRGKGLRSDGVVGNGTWAALAKA